MFVWRQPGWKITQSNSAYVDLARNLLQEWQQYKDVKVQFDPVRTKFPDAVELQIVKDIIQSTALIIASRILYSQLDDEFERYVLMFQTELNQFKDKVTMDILRNGSVQK